MGILRHGSLWKVFSLLICLAFLTVATGDVFGEEKAKESTKKRKRGKVTKKEKNKKSEEKPTAESEENASKLTVVPEEILSRWPAKDVGADAKEYVNQKKTRELWGTIFDLRTGKVTTFQKMIEATKGVPLVLVGEKHDNGSHHVLQTDVLEAMHANNPKMALAMEMFWKIYQPVLDKFTKGEIDEETMLKETHYSETWGFDWQYFKRAVNFAAKNNFPVIGMNLPKTIMRKIARGVELNPSEQAMLPKEIDMTNKEHRAHVMMMFQGMFEALKTRAPELLKSGFEDRFYRGQCTWDEMFAEVASDYLTKNKGHQMVIFVGGGHTEKRHNIPERFKRRSKMEYISIYPVGLESRRLINWDVMLNIKTADFVVITKPF